MLIISGGPGVLAADAAEQYGLALPTLPAGRQAAIRGYAPHFAATGNPVDLTPQCAPEAFGPAIRAVYDEPTADGVIVINCGLDIAEFGAGLATAASATGKATTAYLLDVPQVRQAVTTAGIACFDSPEAAARGYAARVRR